MGRRSFYLDRSEPILSFVGFRFMKHWFYLLLLICVATACNRNTSSVPPPVIVTPTTTEYTWLALGDSYTIGQSVADTNRYPTQTTELLRKGGVTIRTPDYIATTGWTTQSLQNAIQAINPSTHTIVSLLIGVNDQFQFNDTTGYRLRFTQLLLKAIELANNKPSHVFVLSIPDYSVTPFAASFDRGRISREIDWFNFINRSVSLQYKCTYLDITASTREVLTNRSLLAADSLHLSGIEYRKWAERLTPMILPLLK